MYNNNNTSANVSPATSANVSPAAFAAVDNFLATSAAVAEVVESVPAAAQVVAAEVVADAPVAPQVSLEELRRMAAEAGYILADAAAPVPVSAAPAPQAAPAAAQPSPAVSASPETGNVWHPAMFKAGSAASARLPLLAAHIQAALLEGKASTCQIYNYLRDICSYRKLPGSVAFRQATEEAGLLSYTYPGGAAQRGKRTKVVAGPALAALARYANALPAAQ